MADTFLRMFDAAGTWRRGTQTITGAVPWDFDAVARPAWAHTGEDWLAADRLGPALAGATVVPLAGTGTDLYSRATATAAAAGQRVVIQLEAGHYALDTFRMIGSSGDPKYAFSLWHPNIRGFLGRGAEYTFVELLPNSMPASLLSAIQGMKYAAAGNWATLQAGVLRLDSTPASPTILGGITFRAADQQNITALDSSFAEVGVVTPQPAPHRGLLFYGSSGTAAVYMSHCRFQGFARAVTSAPPFECANYACQRGYATIWNTESDGRRSEVFDPSRPARCGVNLINDEYEHRIIRSHFHSSNISRYAANDENYDTGGLYEFRESKIDRITINRNTDPNLNGGQSLGGWTDASAMGWESTSADIVIADSIISMDNPNTDSGQKPMHLQLTKTGDQTRTGGSLTVTGTVFRSPGRPLLDGWCLMRLDDATQWYADPAARMAIYHPVTGARLQPHIYTGVWPPSMAELAAAGITKDTHYLAQRI